MAPTKVRCGGLQTRPATYLYNNLPQGGVFGHRSTGAGGRQLPFPVWQVAMPALPEPSGTPHTVAQPVGLFKIHEPESPQRNDMMSMCWQIPGECGKMVMLRDHHKLHNRKLNLHMYTTIGCLGTLRRRFRRFSFSITNFQFGADHLAHYTGTTSRDSANFGTIFWWYDLPFSFACGHITRKKKKINK